MGFFSLDTATTVTLEWIEPLGAATIVTPAWTDLLGAVNANCVSRVDCTSGRGHDSYHSV